MLLQFCKFTPFWVIVLTSIQSAHHSPFIQEYAFIAGIVLATVVFSWQVSSIIADFCAKINQKKCSTAGNCVLITGCDTGFGRETALHLNRVGFSVFAGCLLPAGDGARKLRQDCKDPDKMHIMQFDVRSEADISQVYDRIQKHTKATGEQLKSLINNAGIAGWSALEWGTMDQDIEPVISIDLTAVIKITMTFIPLLRQTLDSRIIFMTSQITHFAVPFLAPYAVAKRGVRAFADSLRAEVDMDPESYGNMKILNVEPTSYKTGLLQYDSSIINVQKTWDRTSKSVQQAYGSQIRDGFINFVTCCRYFQIMDFIAIRPDLNEIARVMEHIIRIEDPNTDYAIMPFYTYYVCHWASVYLPDECIEAVFGVKAPGLKYFSFISVMLSRLQKKLTRIDKDY